MNTEFVVASCAGHLGGMEALHVHMYLTLECGKLRLGEQAMAHTGRLVDKASIVITYNTYKVNQVLIFLLYAFIRSANFEFAAVL